MANPFVTLSRWFAFVALSSSFADSVDAQTTRYADSLELLIVTAVDDTGKVLLLNELAYTYAEFDLTKAKKTGLSSVALAERIHYTKGLSSAQCALGNITSDQNELDEALQFYQKALQGKEQIGDRKGAATITTNIGMIYKRMARYKEALQAYKSALAQRIVLEDKRGEGDSYSNIGSMYGSMGNTDSSMHYIRKALKVRTAINDEKGIATCYHNMSATLVNSGRFKEALTYDLKAATYFEKTNDLRALITVYTGIAKLNKRLANSDGAIRYAKDAEAISLKTGVKAGLADIYALLGEAYQDKHQNTEAKKYFLLALKLAEAANDEEQCTGILGGLAIIAQRADDASTSYVYYRKALEIARRLNNKQNLVMILNSYAESKLHFKDTAGLWMMMKEAEAIAVKGNYKPKLLLCYKNYADYFLIANDSLNSILYLRRSNGVADHLFSDKVATSFAAEQTRYETGRKDAEILLLRNQQVINSLQLEKQTLQIRKKQYQMFAILSFVLLLCVAAFAFYKRQKRFADQKRDRELFETEARERMRIARDVHDDLGSGLSRISLMASLARSHTNGNDRLDKEMLQIASVSAGLVDNMRDLIWVLDPENTTLESLTARIREYCSDAIEGTGINLQLDFPSVIPIMNINRDAQRNLFLTVKEMLHNCVKHAGTCKFHIVINLTRDMLQIELKDDGAGFDFSSAKGRGNGLRNMSARIASIGGTIQINSVTGVGTTATLQILLAKLAVPALAG